MRNANTCSHVNANLAGEDVFLSRFLFDRPIDDNGGSIIEHYRREATRLKRNVSTWSTRARTACAHTRYSPAAAHEVPQSLIC